MIRRRSIPMACALAAIFGCGGSAAQTPAIADLQRSATCTARVPTNYPGGPGLQTTLRVGSGGGWCWFTLTATWGSVKYVGTYVVTRAPAHGEILTGEVSEKARIAYRPTPGFVGDDSFVFVNKMTRSEWPVAVTVVR